MYVPTSNRPKDPKDWAESFLGALESALERAPSPKKPTS